MDCTMGLITILSTTIWENMFGTFSKRHGLSQIQVLIQVVGKWWDPYPVINDYLEDYKISFATLGILDSTS